MPPLERVTGLSSGLGAAGNLVRAVHVIQPGWCAPAVPAVGDSGTPELKGSLVVVLANYENLSIVAVTCRLRVHCMIALCDPSYARLLWAVRVTT